jgi:hypothetical protein
MKQYRVLVAFAALLLMVGLACGVLSPDPTQAPPPTKSGPSQPQAPSDPNDNNQENQGNSGSSDIVTFTDQNNLLAFDLPGDWTYENVPGEDGTYYIDVFTSPDESAKMESLVYDDGTAFTGTDNGRFALYLLNTFYSNTGQEGDIRVGSDQIMQDGSERLEWSSKSGGYSGVSFFELRGDPKTTFLMLTAWWDNNADQATLDAINNAISTYYVP